MSAHRELTDEEYRLFSERIARGLAERPLTVPPREHRERVAELLRQLGDTTFYHLLGIDPASGAREVHEAYDEVARLVHPSHARRVGLEGREGVLKLLFERATLGYLTLSETDRRKEYDREVGPARWTALRTSTASREEEGRRCLARARVLAESEDFHTAIELLRQSVRLAPGAEAYGLLGLLLAKNPQWLEEALESLERAVEMGATEPGLPEALKEVREKLGQQEKPAQPIPFRKKKG
jgi:tetratricopeptide (TPR) repeat protein